MQNGSTANMLNYLWIGVLLLLPVVFDNQLIDPATVPRTGLTILAVLLGLSLVIFQASSRNPFTSLLKSTPIVWLYFLFILWCGFSSIGAVNYDEALANWLKDVVFFALFSLMVFSFGKDDLRKIPQGIVVSGALFLGIGIYQLQLTGFFSSWEIDPHEIRSTLGHKNLYSSASLFISIASIFSIAKSKGVFRAFSVIVLLLALFFIALLQTRTVWLACGFTLAIVTSIFLLRKPLSRLSDSLRLNHVAILSLLLLSGVGLFMTQSERDLLPGLSVYEENQSQGMYTVRERALLWNFSKHMVIDHPISGVGSGQWKIHFPKYGSGIWRARQGLVQFQRPHNDFIWVLTENGLVGFILYGMLFMLSVFKAIKTVLDSRTNEELRAVTWFALAILLAYFIVAQFSFPRERIFHQWVMHIALAVVWVPQAISVKPSTMKWPLLALLSGILLFSGWVFGQRYLGEKLSLEMTKNRVSGDWQSMLKHANESDDLYFYSLDPVSMPTEFYKGLALLNLGQVPSAISTFENALQAHPYNIHVLNNLGASNQLVGNTNMAIEYYQLAKKIAPYYIDGTLNLASAYFNTGQVGEAYQVLREDERFFSEDKTQFHAYMEVILNTLYLNTWESLFSESDTEEAPAVSYDELLMVHRSSVESNVPLLPELEEFTLNKK